RSRAGLAGGRGRGPGRRLSPLGGNRARVGRAARDRPRGRRGVGTPLVTDHPSFAPNRGAPTPAIAVAGDPAEVRRLFDTTFVEVDDRLLERLRAVCPEVS